MNTIDADLDAEFDTEIAVRERLLETLHARLRWAQLMQQAVQSGTAPPDFQLFQHLTTASLRTCSTRDLSRCRA